MPFRIIPRSEWGARHPAGFQASPLPVDEVWLHHSVTIAPDLVQPFDDDFAAVRTLEQIGQDRFGGGISYTYAVTPAGLIFEGHGDARQGAHTGGRNDIARAIVLVGNYDVNAVPASMKAAVAWLLQDGKRRGVWREARLNGGHTNAPGQSTACPGRFGLAAIPEINKLAAASGPVQEGGTDVALKDDSVPVYKVPGGTDTRTKMGADEALGRAVEVGWRNFYTLEALAKVLGGLVTVVTQLATKADVAGVGELVGAVKEDLAGLENTLTAVTDTLPTKEDILGAVADGVGGAVVVRGQLTVGATEQGT